MGHLHEEQVSGAGRERARSGGWGVGVLHMSATAGLRRVVLKRAPVLESTTKETRRNVHAMRCDARGITFPILPAATSA